MNELVWEIRVIKRRNRAHFVWFFLLGVVNAVCVGFLLAQDSPNLLALVVNVLALALNGVNQYLNIKEL